MSKAVMISIKPKWVGLIASGQKTVEVRKTRPKIDTPFKCYIYQTKAHLPAYLSFDGKPDNPCGVVGEFICDEIQLLDIDSVGAFIRDDNGDVWYMDEIGWKLGLSEKEVIAYCGYKRPYGWQISELKMYDKPKELSEFHKPVMPTGLRYEDDTIKHPFQSWGYVEEL